MSNNLTIDDYLPATGATHRACAASANSHPPLEAAASNSLAIAGEFSTPAPIHLETPSTRLRPNASEEDSGGIDLKQHRNRCAVCKHRDRAAIEEAFLRWRNVGAITQEFKLPARDSVYRHAHAFGLFARRKANLRFALEHIIEQSEFVSVNAPAAVIDAVRAYAHIDDDGHWVQPPTTHIILPGASLSARTAHAMGRRKSVRDKGGNQK